MVNSEERKRQILDHISRTNNNKTANTDSKRGTSEREERKKRVMEHVNKTRNT